MDSARSIIDMSLDELIREKYYLLDSDLEKEWPPRHSKEDFEEEEKSTSNPIEDLISEVEYISSWSFISLPEKIKKKALDLELDKIQLKNKLLRQKMVWSKMASDRENANEKK